MANLDSSKNPWEVSPYLNTDRTLYTAGTLLDRDIKVLKATGVTGSGSATTPTASGASTSTSLSGTTLTVARSVTPTVTAGYVAANSGIAGTVTITGTVPTQEKTVTSSNTDQTVTPDTGKLLSKVTVNKMATQTPTTAFTNSGLGTYFNSGTSSDYNVSITPNYTNSAGYVAAHSATNNGGIGYYKIKNLTQTSTGWSDNYPIANLYNHAFRLANIGFNTSAGTTNELNGLFSLAASGADAYLWHAAGSANVAYTSYYGPLVEIPTGATKIRFTVFNENGTTVNTLFTKNYVTYWDANKKSLNTSYGSINANAVLNVSDFPSGTKYLTFRIGYGSSAANTTYKFKVMVSAGSNQVSWIPYYNPNLGSVNAASGGALTYSNVSHSSTVNTGIRIGRSAITCSVNPGWITSGSTATALDGDYLTGVTLQAPSSGTRSFSITVPNGASATQTFTFKVDSNRNVWIE